MTFVSSLSQIPNEKQIRKELKKIIFGKKVKCPCRIRDEAMPPSLRRKKIR